MSYEVDPQNRPTRRVTTGAVHRRRYHATQHYPPWFIVRFRAYDLAGEWIYPGGEVKHKVQLKGMGNATKEDDAEYGVDIP